MLLPMTTAWCRYFPLASKYRYRVIIETLWKCQPIDAEKGLCLCFAVLQVRGSAGIRNFFAFQQKRRAKYSHLKWKVLIGHLAGEKVKSPNITFTPSMHAPLFLARLMSKSECSIVEDLQNWNPHALSQNTALLGAEVEVETAFSVFIHSLFPCVRDISTDWSV